GGHGAADIPVHGSYGIHIPGKLSRRFLWKNSALLCAGLVAADFVDLWDPREGCRSGSSAAECALHPLRESSKSYGYAHHAGGFAVSVPICGQEGIISTPVSGMASSPVRACTHR